MAKKRQGGGGRSRSGSGGGSGNRSGNRSGGGRRRRNSGYRNNGQGRRNDRNSEPVEIDDSELTEGTGLLELHPNGYGFLRSAENNYTRERTDPFVPGTMIEKFGLRPGIMIRGMVQPARRQQGPRLPRNFGYRWNRSRRLCRSQTL